jgi:3-oxoacyl-[acyl-carrier protein] reductase
MAQEGVRLAITARRAERLEQLAGQIAAAGMPRPSVIVADLTLPQGPAEVARQAVAALGPVEILVNNAGGSRPFHLDAGEGQWDEAFLLNFTAARRLTAALLPAMREQRWGRIVNTGGSMEPRSMNGAAAAKAALHLWAKGLSCDVAKDGVTVNTVVPGRIKSEQILNRLLPTEDARASFIRHNIPIGYLGEPEDIANLVAFLASPLASYITGAVIPVDGGMHFFAP